MSRTQGWICWNCGVEHEPSVNPPESCVLCSDDRESITHKPQRWTTLAQLQGTFTNVFTPLDPGIIGIRTEPSFGIGQEAYLLNAGDGNVLWECLGYVDPATVRALEMHGRLSAIVISHPHFLGSVVEWSEIFGGVPVYIHSDNMPWVPRKSSSVEFWTGDRKQVGASLKIIRTGGHFPGSCVLHQSTDGMTNLFTSDTILPVEDRRWVSFMYSYPNLIPLGKKTVERISAAIADLEFDRIYGGPMYGGGGSRPIISSDAKNVVDRSIKRYLDHLTD